MLLEYNVVVDLLRSDRYTDKIFIKLEKLKSLSWQNSFTSIKLFGNFIRAKKILAKYNIRVLVDRKIKTGESAKKIFSDFVFPAKVLSLENEIIVDDISGIKQLQHFLESKKNATDFLLEEKINGVSVNCFVSLLEDKKMLYFDYKLNLTEEDLKRVREVVRKVNKVIKAEKFALFEFIIRESNKKIYLTNIFLDFNLFYKKKDVIENIVKKYNIKVSSLFLK